MRSHPLILASGSPRRSSLLTAAGIPFEVRVSHVDETLEGHPDPMPAAQELALRKAKAVALGILPGHWILGADTVVALGPDGAARLLGKPESPVESRAMLEALSGTRHRVVTGVCVVRTSDGKVFVDSECTEVSMREIQPEEVAAYVASEEWRDKAGGYAIQENADAFVDSLHGGGFDNVVGLPVDRVLKLLARSGLAFPGR